MSQTAGIRRSHQGAQKSAKTAGGPARPAEGGARHRKLIFFLPFLCLLVLVVAFSGQFVGVRHSLEPLPPLPAERSLIVARRVGVAFDDSDQTWAHAFRARGLPAPAPPELVLFSNARLSPCSGTSAVGGPFYCPLDDKVSLDIVFLDQIEQGMDREAALGTTLVVARVVAEHIQSELGVPPAVTAPETPGFSREHTLQADCLAGVWAGLAARRIGVVPDGLYARLLQRGQRLMQMHVNGGKPDQPALDLFLLGDFAARDAAFQRGLKSRAISSCPPPT